jgi:hypothetical protein
VRGDLVTCANCVTDLEILSLHPLNLASLSDDSGEPEEEEDEKEEQ